MNLSPDLSDPWYRESRAALLRIAEDWTDTLLMLSSGSRAVPHQLAEQIVTSSARYFTHPMLRFAQVTQDMSLLAVCVTNLDRYVNHGTWDAEDDDSLGPRTDDERTEFLQREVDWYLFRLLRALDPCVDCVRHCPLERWEPARLGQVRCPEHRAVYTRPIPDSRPVHSGQISSRAFQLLNFGGDDV